jgi:PAS domain S-box-containing protein
MSALHQPLQAPHSRAAYLGIASAVASAVLLLLASTWLARANLQGVVKCDVIGDNLVAAQLATETLLSTLKDAETGERGFLLTNDPDYLQPYDAARARLDGDLDRVDTAALGVPERQRRIARIRELTGEKMSQMAGTVALRQSDQTQAARERVREDADRNVMDAIRVEVDALQEDAVTRLAEARASSRSPVRWGAVTGMGGMAAGLLVWVALVQRSASRRITTNELHLDRFARAFGLTQGMICDRDGRIIFWSVGAERLYGYDQQQAVGQNPHELLRTAFPQPLPEIEDALMQESHWHGELVHRRQDGALLHVACHWALHRGEANEADVIIIVSNDITDLKQTEVALRQSELKLQLVLDASDQGVWRWEVGEDTFEQEWDPRCKALFGFEPDARVDYVTWAAAIHIEDREMAEAAVSRALDPADPYDDYICSYRVVRPDGQVIWLASKGAALFRPDPQAPSERRMVRILGTIHDVSDAKRAERERLRAGTLLRTIMETAAGLIYAKDRQGRLLAANEAVLEMIGKLWEEVEGHTDLDFLSDPLQADAVMCSDRQVMEQGRIERVEELVSGEDGRERVWYATKAPMRDSNGQVIGLVGVSVDITDRKRDEDRLRLMVNELNHRVKNTLATVQAIALQTLRGTNTAIRGTLEKRLLAVASAHDVLTREKWEGAALEDVVTGALAPFGGRSSDRFEVSGPPLLLSPRAALALAMGLHELATNGLKHGALSAASGRVGIDWDITTGDSPLLRLIWTERGGPKVSPPTRRGFGLRLLERTLAQDLGGSARINFEVPEGVTCLIEAPLAEVISTADALSLPRVGNG